MLRYAVTGVQHETAITLACSSTDVAPATLRVGTVNLLRSTNFKGEFFYPFIPTTHVLFLFPSSIDPADRSRLASDAEGRASAFLKLLAQSCNVTFSISDAALCQISGCAMVVVQCKEVTDAIRVLDACTEMGQQPASVRMGSQYIYSYPCEPGCAALGKADMPALLQNFYFIPSCIVCADRLESTLTGHSEEMPMCECALHEEPCICLQTSTCVVCELLMVTLQATSGAEGGSPTSVCCQDCDQMSDPWVCVICGYVGCSRYQSMHAKDHYLKTRHFFSINLLTQQIWDYEADGFVHRVIVSLDPQTGGTQRVRYPGREEPQFFEDDDDDYAADAYAAKELKTGAAGSKKAVCAKYDATLGSTNTTYAIVLKSELDAMRESLVAEYGLPKDASSPVSSTPSRDTSTADKDSDPFADMDRQLAEINQVVRFNRWEAVAAHTALQNIKMELSHRQAEAARLKKSSEELTEATRAAVGDNVTASLRLSTSIQELKDTLKEIELNIATQLRLQGRLGAGDAASRIVVMGKGQEKDQRQRKGPRR